ncbi:MAG: HAMP domain-containing histidine kinase [Rhodospirillaceae bacterium]|nr:HAMP domain-containing histidine kinase [Rhodospirillaceae bacterium]MBT4691224.1 HAMP domain-containing histidine kinase [Rhodospirillaceae bacterium]MBT5082511.1 HAMP domain-containing histidine kinase [Rhodospirillaceae bacterium]MBT5525386.1 HAMP domain-containing histidine kinase [Rhodospirillaceae bacterium]MBT5880085.1 HAMP domain-containing histidine kinase [Rhodospirillaceae bacterium]
MEKVRNVGKSRRTLPRWLRGLSARLLVLTAVFVMLSEVLIYVPSIARFRLTFLENRIADAHLASLALKATPDNVVSKSLMLELLSNAMVRGIVLKRREARTMMLMEEVPPTVDFTYDLRGADAMQLIADAFTTLAEGGRTLRVVGSFPDQSEGSLDVIVDEALLHKAMIDYSTNIVKLSLVISLLTAGLVFLSLRLLMVLPMRRITASMVAFRKAPENANAVISDSTRGDEIGTAQRELRHMQDGLRTALTQKGHLTALGVAVSKINHDLRNILATAQLVSDRLGDVEDPTVRQIAPRLMQSIDRAIDLCSQSLSFGRADEAAPKPTTFPLRTLVDDMASAAGLPDDGSIQLHNRVGDEIILDADREQIFRVLMNLARNSIQALDPGTKPGEISVTANWGAAGAIIEFSDSGPGLPARAREHLFEAFTGSARAGGTGLGLTIAKELTQAHGGNLTLVSSDDRGTVFRIDLPGGPV